MDSILTALVQRVRQLGGGLLLVPVTLVVLSGLSLAGKNALTLLVIVVAAIIVMQAPALARDLVPGLLVGLGLWGFLLAVSYARGDTHSVLYGAVLAGAGSWRTYLVVPQALVLLAAGLWLGARTGARRRYGAVFRRLRSPGLGWGVLLIPLAAAGFGLFGSSDWTWSFAVFAVLAVLLFPVLAADLVPVGLILLALYAIRLPALTRQAVGNVSVQPSAAALPQVAKRIKVFAQQKVALAQQKVAPAQQKVALAQQKVAVAQQKAALAQHQAALGQRPPRLLPLPAVPRPLVTGWVPGPPPAHWYGFVQVGIPYWAPLAAAEALFFLAFGLWLVPRTLAPHARLGERAAVLEGRVRRLAQTRTDAVDGAAAELRRVERDLHDGAQARLVAVGMNLRAAERTMHTSPEVALALIAEARETSARALAELRDLVRGIHPPVLADRGLGDAVRALALDAPLRTDLSIDLPGRPEPPVESAAYFAAAEVLANAVKHASARALEIQMQHRRGVLRITVTDDGVGGADPARGTGLRGVERRLGAFDGILAVNSPPGGPTIVVIEVPCTLSSQKTSSC
jgi:signal transduction histidine kinase